MKRILKLMISPTKKTDIFAEGNTFVEIGNEGGGEFIIISQDDDSWNGKLAFDKEEWRDIKVAVDEMFETLIVED